MLLNAKDINCIFVSLPPVRAAFEVASANEMVKLGEAFSQVVCENLNQNDKVTRIGFKARPDTGKSTLISGILNPIRGRVPVEKYHDMYHSQYTWVCQNGQGQYIRNIDTWLKADPLPSYANDNIQQFSYTSFVDLVEHPENDKNDTFFDCLIILKRDWLIGCKRNVTLFSTHEFAETDGFQQFLKESEPFSRETLNKKTRRFMGRIFGHS